MKKIDQTERENGLSSWQLTMMAVGTVIGGSFFLGSAVAFHAAGPSVLLAYILGGVLVYFILFALSEMTVANPHYGSFRTFAAQAFGQGTGFVLGWVYWLGLALGMSSEATAVSILVRSWLPRISVPLLAAGIIIGITLLNLLGVDKLSRLESGLAAVKVLAILSFIVLALVIILGFLPGRRPAGAGGLTGEALFPGGGASVAGSMLIVMFAFSGFEVIGLAASEARHPKITVPKAIRQTVLILVGLYILSAGVLLPLIPTAAINENISPFVAALDRHGFGWAGTALNIVLVTAILSTMLASVFGLGRILRSLADDALAPRWLKDKKDVPTRGILFSGFAMLAGLGVGLLFPNVYLFLVSSGGFAMLFTYAIIMATHIRFRKRNGCPPDGKCQMRGYPYTSWFVLIALILSIFSMPFVPGQAPGLVAGIAMTAFFTAVYAVMRALQSRGRSDDHKKIKLLKTRFLTEAAKEEAVEREDKAHEDK